MFNPYCFPLQYLCLTPCPPFRVWDIQTGQLIEDLFHHSDMVTSLKFTTDTLVTGSDVSEYKLPQLYLKYYHFSCIIEANKIWLAHMNDITT